VIVVWWVRVIDNSEREINLRAAGPHGSVRSSYSQAFARREGQISSWIVGGDGQLGS